MKNISWYGDQVWPLVLSVWDSRGEAHREEGTEYGLANTAGPAYRPEKKKSFEDGKRVVCILCDYSVKWTEEWTDIKH